MSAHHPVFAHLGASARRAPAVVAHRGDSSNFPENTLAAFAAGQRLGVAMQEFDVRATRDGVLACIHDATFDRTTDAPVRMGPGAMVAETTWAEAARLDAGAWRGDAHRGCRIPTLADVLQLLATGGIAMIEHKAGAAADYVAAVRQANAVPRAILQSFDWTFVAAAQRLAPEIAFALLGPTDTHPTLGDEAIAAAHSHGAGMLHWAARDVTAEGIARCHAADLLVCTYTTDDDLGLCGGAALGLDAMCTNVPARMLQLQRDGRLLRPSIGPARDP